ncbi:site-specific integrase [Williamwhitmania taraxaci]|uniref:hypothetical protein n=1 Tax=Williamwhitmania taraxaci TaxID=1640674 RepID=UPI001FCCF6D5|nr:hypothetical protein [Williamwhitmania taraxaci]
MKTIGETIEIEIPLTTYVARHTFATVMKRSGVSTSIISESLGHDSELFYLNTQIPLRHALAGLFLLDIKQK